MQSSKYIIKKYGEAKQLELENFNLGDPAVDEIQLEQLYLGINFIDIYQRRGLYPLELPATLGFEAIARVIKTGLNVIDYKEGDLIGYAIGTQGAYCQHRNLKADLAFPVPENLANELAGNLLRGLTAEYLINRIGKQLECGDTVLFYAIAGGVGLIALQWLKNRGVNVIGTTSSEEKAKIAKSYGCNHVIVGNLTQVEQKVLEITKDKKLKMVYDSLGKETFNTSINLLARRGTLVTFGNATGAVEPFQPLLLSQKGSLYITRPMLADYYTTKNEKWKYSKIYFKQVATGKIKTDQRASFSFSNLPEAHRYLETKKSIGSTLVKI